MKLGRLATRHDPRTFKLADFFSVGRLVAPPLLRDWSGQASPNFGMRGNDVLGDCVIATMAHMIQVWTSMVDREIAVPDQAVLDAYRQVSGYDGTPATDRGCVMLDAMNHWRKVGVGGHKIRAFMSIDPRNRIEVETAINLFGGIAVGFSLPISARSQTVWDVAMPSKWTRDYEVGSWGGHAVACPAYSRNALAIVTWGRLKVVTTEFFMTYADECYAVVSEDWVNQTRVAPNGFDLAKLETFLAAL